MRLDKGDLKNLSPEELENSSKTLFNYFLIGLSLPNDAFWVNLRPDSPDNIIDNSLALTDIGKIMLETDLQLKKDIAQSTSPQTTKGKAYWDKLYQKAEELYGSTNISIPTLTRPWIVPGEIIIGETSDSAYIYKATLKVLIEEDYISSQPSVGQKAAVEFPIAQAAVSSKKYTFSDPRLKELNRYSTQLIKETIISKLTYEVNTSRKYAPLRQVYYSLILAQWFKARHRSQRTEKANSYLSLIDSGNLTNLTSTRPYDKLAYFKQYQDSFAQGEYNLQEPRYTPSGQTIRSYFSGGEKLNIQIPPVGTIQAGSSITIIPSDTLPSSPTKTELINTEMPKAASSLININASLKELEILYNKIIENFKVMPPKESDTITFPVSGKEFKFTSGKISILGPLIFIPIEDRSGEFFKSRFDISYNKLHYETLKNTIQGDVKYINSKLAQIGELYLKMASNVLLVPPFSAVPAQSINPYSALIISEMLTTDFKGKTVIDAGGGEGLLALIALKLGAKRVIIIEKDETERQLARTILEAQGYEKGKHFDILDTDLNNKKKLKKELEALGISQKEIIGLANIGPLYGKANHKAIELFIELGASKIINGGYYFNSPTHKENLPHREEFDKIISLLKNAGYNVERYPPYNPKLPIPTGYGKISATIKTTQPLTGEKQSMPANPDEKKSASPATFGGIDFRNLPIVSQARSNLSANTAGSAITRLKDIDLNQEWLDIQNLTRAGISPSPERIREYLQGLCLKDDYSEEKAENIILCLADILRLEEENYLSTDALLKDILIVLSSTNDTPGLKEAFLGKAVK